MIQIEDLEIRLPSFRVTGVNLAINPGEFFALIGPTGAGKTLILEAIGGIVPVTGGRIRINGSDVTHLPPEKRNVGIVVPGLRSVPTFGRISEHCLRITISWKE